MSLYILALTFVYYIFWIASHIIFLLVTLVLYFINILRIIFIILYFSYTFINKLLLHLHLYLSLFCFHYLCMRIQVHLSMHNIFSIFTLHCITLFILSLIKCWSDTNLLQLMHIVLSKIYIVILKFLEIIISVTLASIMVYSSYTVIVFNISCWLIFSIL